MRSRRVFSIQNHLLAKSKEAALNAVATFNNPLTTFKSEAFIVLMVIAWMYLLHAYYRGQGIDYRYYDTLPSGRKRYHRTKTGAKKYWELERCLNEAACPLDSATKANLRFLIGLRHEIEHQVCLGLDEQMSGRYLAACLNYEAALTMLFGAEHSVGDQLGFTLQFRDLFRSATPETKSSLPSPVTKYIQEFDAALPDEDFSSQSYAVRLLFTQKTANHKGQADRVIEFVPPSSELSDAIAKEYWVKQSVEKPKYLAKQVVAMMHNLGFPRFTLTAHTRLWKDRDGKNPKKSFGVQLGVSWFWYENWIEVVREECETHTEVYGPAPALEDSA
jgi:hypothetical protein